MPSAESVVQVSATKFVVATNQPHTGFKVCGNKRSSFAVNRLTTVNIEHGCVGETRTHLFAPSDQSFSTEANRWALTFRLPTDPELLSDKLDFEVLDRIREKANSTLRHFDRMDIRQALERIQLESLNTDTHWWSYLLNLPPMAVSSLALGFALYNWCRNRRTLTMLRDRAPQTAPTTVNAIHLEAPTAQQPPGPSPPPARATEHDEERRTAELFPLVAR